MKSKLTKTNQIKEMDLEALEQLKSISISCVREKIFELQQGICPLCGNPIVRPVLDHQHKQRKSDPNGVNGNGLIRGVLCVLPHITEQFLYISPRILRT